MDIHHWNAFWEDGGILVSFANLSHISLPCPTILLLKSSRRWSPTQQFDFSLFALDLKTKQIPSYRTRCTSKMLEDVRNRKMHQQSCRISSKGFENFIDAFRNYKYHLNIYDKKTQPVLYSVISWVKMTEVVSKVLSRQLKKRNKWRWFRSNIQKSLVLCQMGTVFSNSYLVPPDWTSCCLLFVKWQLPMRAQMCFLQLRIRKVELFYTVFSMIHGDIRFR